MAYGSSMVKVLRTALGVSVLLSLYSEADARLTGSMELGYASYSRELNGTSNTSSSFNQQYSLLYSTAGALARGKLGVYRLDLGYEWAYLNNTENSAPLSSGHLLYSGDYKFESKQLPVLLNLYSRDLSRISVQTDGTSGINLTDSTSGGDILTSGVASSLTGGIRTSTGGQLYIGTFNSPLYPRLAELPKMILKYNDEYVSDLNTLVPQHYRTRNLSAAVGKGPLWLQYRNYQVIDYLKTTNFQNNDSSSQERTFTFGNVDNMQRRQWVDISNWISISTDVEFSKQSDKQTYIDGKDLYTINLFGVATRPNWKARSFNTFSREVSGTPESRQVEYTTSIPLFLNGTIGVDTDWDARLTSDDNRTINKITGVFETGLQVASLRLTTFKRSPFTFTPSIAFTRKTNFGNGNESKYDLHLESSSTRRFSDIVGINAAYDISYIQREENTGSTSNRINQTLSGRLTYRLAENIRLEAQETLTASFGTTLTENIKRADASSTATADVFDRSETTDNYIRSQTGLKAAWNPTGRLRVAATASVDILQNSASSETDTVLGFNQLIEYSIPNFRISADMGYAKRIGVSPDTDTNASANVIYTPQRNLDYSLRARYSQIENTASSRTTTEILQQVKYIGTRNSSLSSNNKFFEISQMASYLKSDGGQFTGAYTTVRRFTLIGNYYPYRNLFVGVTGRYSLLDPGSVSEWLANGVIGLNSPKLQATIEYGYGRRVGGMDNRIEKKISANMKKQF